eukprot:5138244-Amphidinium_carterae.2
MEIQLETKRRDDETLLTQHGVGQMQSTMEQLQAQLAVNMCPGQGAACGVCVVPLRVAQIKTRDQKSDYLIRPAPKIARPAGDSDMVWIVIEAGGKYEAGAQVAVDDRAVLVNDSAIILDGLGGHVCRAKDRGNAMKKMGATP